MSFAIFDTFLFYFYVIDESGGHKKGFGHFLFNHLIFEYSIKANIFNL